MPAEPDETVAPSAALSSEAKLRAAFELSPTVLAITAGGRFVDVNDAFLRLHGYAREEVIGCTVSELDLWVDPEQRLRALITLIDRQKRKPIYTDFEDYMGSEAEVDLPGFAAPDGFARFRAKARAFPPSDLDELEAMLTASGVGGADDVRKAKEESQIEFVNLIVDHLTEHGVMGAALLYESPFTFIAPRGPDDIFTSTQIDELIALLDHITATAVAA